MTKDKDVKYYFNNIVIGGLMTAASIGMLFVPIVQQSPVAVLIALGAAFGSAVITHFFHGDYQHALHNVQREARMAHQLTAEAKQDVKTAHALAEQDSATSAAGASGSHDDAQDDDVYDLTNIAKDDDDVYELTNIMEDQHDEEADLADMLPSGLPSGALPVGGGLLGNHAALQALRP